MPPTRSRGGCSTFDPLVFGEAVHFASAKDAAAALVPYIERELAQGTRLHAITRHLHGLFRAVPGARAYRRKLAAASRARPGPSFLLRRSLWCAI